MAVDIGDWKADSPSSAATGALKRIREKVEAAELAADPDADISWVEKDAVGRFIQAVIEGYHEELGGTRYKREAVTDQVAVGTPGPATVSFVTNRQFGDGRTRAVMNGIRDFSLTRNTPTTFDYDPYGDGFGPRAGDVVIIEEVVAGWDVITVVGGSTSFVTESTYVVNSVRILFNGIFMTTGYSSTDGKNWTIDPYGDGLGPLAGDSLHIEGTVDAFDFVPA
jgi:hypothetical protein